MTAWLLAGLTLASLPAIEDDGQGCPDARAVQAEVQRLTGRAAAVRARLVHAGDSVDVLLLDRSGHTAARRSFVMDRSCDALAAAAAVSIAAWSAQWAAPEISWPGGHVPGGRLAWEVGAAGAGSWTPDGATAGGTIVASLGDARSGWGGTGALLFEGSRGLPLAGGGEAAWEREAFSLGPELRFAWGRWALRVAAEGVVAVVAASGQGLSVDESSASVDPGAALSARLSVRLGPVRPFLGLWGFYWLRQEAAEVSGTAAAALPQQELVAALGLAFGSDGAPVRSGAGAP